ncbi:MAG: phenylalanine--tRNA ligase subunit alpha [Clostridia bacterium]|nr:phenylalanine--tRNA ligase subunit alpha [Clostridia bacterium]
MDEELLELKKQALQEIANAQDSSEIVQIKSKYLGKRSQISRVMSSLKNYSIEERRTLGQICNTIKNEIVEALKAKNNQLISETSYSIDITMPVDEDRGSLSPITIVGNEVCEILEKMGFAIVSGPEIEDEYHNFDALNIPSTHPARDMQDTYWLGSHKLLRTHTSPCQVRAMEKYGAPLRIAAPGRCFRNEDIDASHENTFFQLEGMCIDKNISIPNLIYVMKSILSEIFDQEVQVRLRPGYFPFVEPGFELDIKCLICEGAGCSTCKGSGWIELCPCGMIHPNVLRINNIDPNEYSGFAFGIGLTRLAMMKYHINDIRVFNTCNLEELEQFGIV